MHQMLFIHSILFVETYKISYIYNSYKNKTIHTKNLHMYNQDTKLYTDISKQVLCTHMYT